MSHDRNRLTAVNCEVEVADEGLVWVIGEVHRTEFHLSVGESEVGVVTSVCDLFWLVEELVDAFRAGGR